MGAESTASAKDNSSKASVPLNGYIMLVSNRPSGVVPSACACQAIAHTLYRGSSLLTTYPPNLGSIGQVATTATAAKAARVATWGSNRVILVERASPVASSAGAGAAAEEG